MNVNNMVLQPRGPAYVPVWRMQHGFHHRWQREETHGRPPGKSNLQFLQDLEPTFFHKKGEYFEW